MKSGKPPARSLVTSAALHGLQPRPIEIGVAITPAYTPAFEIHGLRVDDDRDSSRLAAVRINLANLVTQALRAQRQQIPQGLVTITVRPTTDVRHLAGIALPTAIAILAANNACDPGDEFTYEPGEGDDPVSHRTRDLRTIMIVGGLDRHGHALPPRGTLPIALDAHANQHAAILVAHNMLHEAAIAPGRILSAMTLAGAVEALEQFAGGRDDRPHKKAPRRSPLPVQIPLSALDVDNDTASQVKNAVAGRRPLLLIGPTWSPAVDIAEAVHGLMGKMTPEEAVTTTSIHSVHGLHEGGGLRVERPIRRPSSDIAAGDLVGWTELRPRRGEATIAHHGVLLLRDVLDFSEEAVAAAVRAARVGVLVGQTRGLGVRIYPTETQLVATATPCPCGLAPRIDCRCTTTDLVAHGNRLRKVRRVFADGGVVVDLEGDLAELPQSG